MKKPAWNKKDLTGKVFGRLTVIKEGIPTPSGKPRWECRCSCGNIALAQTGNLGNGHTVSCGCIRKQDLQKRFSEKYKVDESTGCWVWNACKDTKGYGLFQMGQRPTGSYKASAAHRVSWQIHKGEIPKGMNVLHKCDNPPCVNPDHLFLGTQQDNTNDMIKKGRGIANRRLEITHCKKGHPLYGDNIRKSMKNGRVCRICAIERQNKYEQKLKERQLNGTANNRT